jgi:tRNA-Thr(GGU) m(6)t(6)A37 methyltransferase TsaA
MDIELRPIGYVRNTRREARDDFWGDVVSDIVLGDMVGDDALTGIEAFSHAEVIFYFHLMSDDDVVRGSRHPRNNQKWPKVGILAQRARNRPNRIGLTTAAIVGREARTLRLSGLDAIDGTPVLDIKPVMREFLPRGDIRQPEWSTELMRDYWRTHQP